MPGKKNKKKGKHQPAQSDHNRSKKTMNVMNADSSDITVHYTVRSPKEEKGIIVSDSDWDDIKASYQKLRSVNNAYYTWSSACFSTAITLLVTFITIVFDKKEAIINYIPCYVMFILFVICIIVGIILIVKGKGKESTIESAIDSLDTVINRIERKTSGLDNIKYYGSQDGDRV